ncbi:MAG: arsenosugar biosynthesis radical SAM protein ArsS [Planctomycetota bacterium]|jgi:radical SAM/Cys-rich protein|nr:arsenosugar biosynthesis radical SAM protein ArsS [Planctomycetota bacterium]
MDAPITIPSRLSEAEQLDVIAASPVPGFDAHLRSADLHGLRAGQPDIIQVNIGKLCNQRCQHCHVDAGPHQKTANMDWRTCEAVLDLVRASKPRLVDITGGAPELNPHFRELVVALRQLGVPEIIDRCNLSVLELPQHQDLAAFLAEQRVHVVASLPAVNEAQTDAQRGDGIFARSIQALQRLNALGYGRDDSALELSLMSNPAGAFLPAPQAASEKRFKTLLAKRYGVSFTRLIQLTNMPISRFLEFLVARGLHHDYMQRLSAAFNPSAVSGLMCLNTLSIGWDGQIYDCDFNQMLKLPVAPESARSIFDLRLDALAGRPIVVNKHCLGCTAGQGSSCGGTTAG